LADTDIPGTARKASGAQPLADFSVAWFHSLNSQKRPVKAHGPHDRAQGQRWAEPVGKKGGR
jgi:hypothetical protein